MSLKNESLLLSVSVFVALAAPSRALEPVAELVTNERFSGDVFWSVSVDGDAVAAGVPYASVPPHGPALAGAVYVFRRGPGGWFQEAKVFAANPLEVDQMGHSVALRGDVLVAGAPHGTTWEPDEDGKVYVFHRVGGSWVQTHTLVPPDELRTDIFGYAVGFDGVRIVAASSGYSTQPGRVFPFRWDGVEWVDEDSMTGSDVAPDDDFGRILGLQGDTLMVGAPSHDLPLANAGAVYVFRYDGETWSQQAKLMASDAAADDGFGASLALHEDIALIGAPGRAPTGTSFGAVYVFRRTGTQWIEDTVIVSPDPQEGAGFGNAVVFDGSALAVAAPYADYGGYYVGGGAAYLFDYEGLNWVYREKLHRPHYATRFAWLASGSTNWAFFTSQPPETTTIPSTIFGYCVAKNAPCIPALSMWGVGVLTLLVVVFGAGVLRRRSALTSMLILTQRSRNQRG